MFTPAQMHRVNIFLQEQDVEEVMVALARLEVLDVGESAEQTRWSTNADSHWSDLTDTYTSQAHRLESLLTTLNIPRPEQQPPAELHPSNDVVRIRHTLTEVEQAVHAWQEHTAEVKEQLTCLQLLQQSMQLLQPLNISVEEMRNLTFLHLVTGTLPRESFDNLQYILFRIPFVIVPVELDNERLLVFAATDQDNAPILDRALNSIFMEPLELPKDLAGPLAQVITTLQEQQSEAEQRRKELAQEGELLAKNWGETLLTLWGQTRSNALVTRTISRLGHREGIYLITGWVPEWQSLEEVMKTVEGIAEQRASIEVLAPGVGGQQRIPTLLRNPPFLRPFQNIVSTFGFPSYNELDPTPLVALTFVIMFGMMFGDVGHGLLLVLAGLGLRFWGKFTTIAGVLLASGASAMVFGLLYGSLFGRKDILPHIWLSPLNNTMDILIASVIFGVVLLNIGFLLHLIISGRARRWGDFLFSRDGLAGLWFYWALAGGIIALVLGFTLPLFLWFGLVLLPTMLIFLSEPLTRLITGERPLLEGGWGEYSVQAFFELFEALISYISNSFSFIRLGAFAVAHAILSQVVLELGAMAGGIGQWVILLLGTLVIIGFEGAIVSIQTLRLEYYEFFGKFFQGKGRAFVPLRLLNEAEQI